MKNQLLAAQTSDFLYHLGINIANTEDTSDIVKRFGDVKFICMGGTKSRMESMARHIRSVIEPSNTEEPLLDLCEAAHRYAVYKVGPVLCCSHGIGMSSMSVLLHELIKLVWYAKCKDPIFLRIGTSGGLGVKPGTVVVTRHAYNGYLRNEHEIAILGERVVRPARFDDQLVDAIAQCAEESDDFDTVIGNTMAAECFYEGQARLDGSVCHYNEADKMNFLQKAYSKGVLNIEMEATMFSSLTLEAGVRAGEVCVTLINRLAGDQVTITAERKHELELYPQKLIGRFIKKVLLH